MPWGSLSAWLAATRERDAISPEGSGFGYRLGIAICIGALLAYGWIALALISSSGGVDGYVRRVDFVIYFTGAEIVRGEHPEQLYEESAQLAAQSKIKDEV